MSNRDYVFSRKIECIEEEKEYVFVHKACAHPLKPDEPGFIRVDTYLSYFKIKLDGEKTLIKISHDDDLKGSIPTMLVITFFFFFFSFLEFKKKKG